MLNSHNTNHNNNSVSNSNYNKGHKMHLKSATAKATIMKHKLSKFYGYGWMQVFLLLTVLVIGNQSAWQENIRPKLYVELGESCCKEFIKVFMLFILRIRYLNGIIYKSI